MDTLPATFPCNVRDVGGLPLVGGGAVRPGLLFRGDDPGRGDRASGDRLTTDLGIRHVVDLRSEEEQARSGGPGTFVVRDDVVHHPVPYSLYATIVAEGFPTDAADLGRIYARSIAACTPSYVAALEVVAEVDAPVLVHCSHGKDRTGIVIALVLSAIGVERAAIVADFARTGDNLPTLHRASRESGVSIGLSQVTGVLLEAPAETMATFLRVMDAEHGGPLTPLLAAGLEPATVQRLRERLRA